MSAPAANPISGLRGRYAGAKIVNFYYFYEPITFFETNHSDQALLTKFCATDSKTVLTAFTQQRLP